VIGPNNALGRSSDRRPRSVPMTARRFMQFRGYRILEVRGFPPPAIAIAAVRKFAIGVRGSCSTYNGTPSTYIIRFGRYIVGLRFSRR